MCALPNSIRFDEYVDGMVADARKTFDALVQASRSVQNDTVTHVPLRSFELKDVQHTVKLATTLHYSGGYSWNSNTNVCNRYRLQLLIYELKRRGFECRVSSSGSGQLQLDLCLQTGEAQEVARFVKLHGVNVCHGKLEVHDTLASDREQNPSCAGQWQVIA